MRKRVYLAVFAVLFGVAVAVGGWLGLRVDNADTEPAPIPSTVAVELGEVRRTVIAPGQVAYRQSGTASASRPGKIVELLIASGDVVRVGDVIALLDESDASTALTSAEKARDFALKKNASAIELAKLDLKSARITLGQLRLSTGLSDPVPTAADLTLATLEVDRAEIRLGGLEQGIGPGFFEAVEAANRTLAETKIVAAMDGVISEVLVSPGQSVQPGTQIARIINPNDLEIRVTVIEEDLPLVRIGQRAEIIFDAAPADTVIGVVERISPVRVSGEPRPLYMVFITLDKPGRELPELKGGMTADASVVVVSDESVLRLPRSLVRGSSGARVRLNVLTDGVVERRTVTVGIRGDVYASITDGLSIGELVVAE